MMAATGNSGALMELAAVVVPGWTEPADSASQPLQPPQLLCKMSLPYIDDFSSVYGGSLKSEVIAMLAEQLKSNPEKHGTAPPSHPHLPSSSLSSAEDSLRPPEPIGYAIDLKKYVLPERSVLLKTFGSVSGKSRRRKLVSAIQRAALLQEYQIRRLAQLEAAALNKNGAVAWLAALHQQDSEATLLQHEAMVEHQASIDLNRQRKEEQENAGVQIRRARSLTFEVMNSQAETLVAITELRAQLSKIGSFHSVEES